MGDVCLTTKAGQDVLLREAMVNELKAAMRGALLQAGDLGYHDARAVWNYMIDKRPGLIARCAGVSDVIQAVNFAKAHNILVSVRGGGHNFSGTSVCDGGLVIDTSLMKSVRVEVTSQTARVEAGVVWGELDRETQVFGLATTGGTVSNTGIAGLTLGGGIGWLTRQHGLSCDNLLSVDLVTAEGVYLTASHMDNEDLFWGMRGGGGNFGVVTSFEFQLHPVGSIVGGLIVYPMSDAKKVLLFYRDFSRDLPEEANTIGALMSLPDGTPGIAIAVSYNGPPVDGEAAFRPLRKIASPLVENIAPRTYLEMQSMLDGMFPPGRRSVVKSNFISTISEASLDALIESSLPLPSPLSFVAFQQLGGAASRVGKDETAFSHRDAQYDLVFHGMGLTPAEDSTIVEWTFKAWNGVQPYVDRGVYINNLGQEGDEPGGINAAWDTATHERLVALKKKYDPTNMFCHNQNIKPSV